MHSWAYKESTRTVCGQSKMNRNNPRPRPRYIPLFCSQPTQTENDYDAGSDSESSDFPPIRIGKQMSPASAMRRNQHQISLSNEDPPQSQRKTLRKLRRGLGKKKIYLT